MLFRWIPVPGTMIPEPEPVDAVSATALALGASATGLVRTKTTALLTVEETDQALQKNISFRAPGQ